MEKLQVPVSVVTLRIIPLIPFAWLFFLISEIYDLHWQPQQGAVCPGSERRVSFETYITGDYIIYRVNIIRYN